MLAETRESTANLVTRGDARLETLLTSTSTFWTRGWPAFTR
jgi:hypothetical protein